MFDPHHINVLATLTKRASARRARGCGSATRSRKRCGSNTIIEKQAPEATAPEHIHYGIHDFPSGVLPIHISQIRERRNDADQTLTMTFPFGSCLPLLIETSALRVQEKGYNMEKKPWGHKRHILIERLGHVFSVYVMGSECSDQEAVCCSCY